jgi:hypothetical protein
MKELKPLSKNTFVGLLVLTFLLFAPDMQAQKKRKKKKDPEATENTTPAKEKKEKPKRIDELVKSHDVFDGLFTFYQDSTSGSLKMAVDFEHMDKEFIHFYYVENGVAEAGAFRGNYRGSRIFKIEKYFNTIQLVVQNTSSWFDPENALSKSSDANYSHAVIHSAKILGGGEEDGAWLIDADDLFLKEAFGFVKMPPPPTASSKDFSLGSLSSSKTKYRELRNYPENSDILVEYVYENPAPKNMGSRAVTDARNVSIVVQHSILEVPDNDFVARSDDPRVGFFTEEVTDMTSTSATPYRDVIHRWHLKKKDPEAAISEPVQPIIFWIENTTPEALRPIIQDAGERWNKAFEAAGFKNAVQLKVQPDTATWDAGDIRYNVLRWTSSPSPMFGGYGPSFVNPRTGQILGADIMLEWVYLTNRVRYDKLFDVAAMPGFVPEMYPVADGGHYCDFGLNHQYNTQFAKLALQAMGVSDSLQSRLIRESIIELVLHEIGHTLGLMHNMRASQMNRIELLQDERHTKDIGLIGSVMDYAPTHVAHDPKEQGQFYMTTPGPYDVWAITYGYKEVRSDRELEEILARSVEEELAFGNDADDMRSSARGIDPRVMVNDMSSDAISYAVDEMNLADKLFDGLLEKYQQDSGRSYHELRNAYLVLTAKLATAGSVVSRYVGGVYVDRSMIGQPGAKKPFTPVEADQQRRAMKVLEEYIFSPDAFGKGHEMYNFLQMQRRGFNFYASTEDPKLLDRALNIQKAPLSHILHQNTLKRISDSELYGNGYSLSEMMTDLNDAVFAADAGGSVNLFRQNLQVYYVKKLTGMLDKDAKGFTSLAQSMALYNLEQIKGMISTKSGDTATRAHRQHLLFLIEKALDT